MANPWLTHLKKYRASNPDVSLKNAMKQAKKTYKKKGGNVVTGGCLTTRGIISKRGRLRTGGMIKKKKKKKERK